MEYLVFPFGKYKGVKLEDLPSTYIVLALEKFDLPDELKKSLIFIIHARLGVHDLILSAGKYNETGCSKNSYEELIEYAYDIIDFLSTNYQKTLSHE